MRKIDRVFNSSSVLLWIALFLFGVSLLNAWLMVREIGKMQNDARIINQSGMLRGGIQRATKLVLAGENVGSTVKELDALFIELEGTRSIPVFGELGGEYRKMLQELKTEWEQQKRVIALFRNGVAQRAQLLEQSERSWKTANHLVDFAQHTAERQLHFMKLVFYILGLNMAITLLVIWHVRNYLQKKLEFLASHDALTRILNRYSFNKILSNEVMRSRRYKSVLSLVVFDIDRFKLVNDTFGHRTGDLVLRNVTKAVSARIRENDLFFRIGGEEFAVLAVESDVENATLLAERLRKIVELTDFKEVGRITISLGVAQLIQEESEESFFHRADKALYAAKQAGRNRSVTDRSASTKVVDGNSIEGEEQ